MVNASYSPLQSPAWLCSLPSFRERLLKPFNCSQKTWLYSPCPGSDALHTSQAAVNKVIMS